jgi:C4-dicarboxylate-specific signal transduction histidine kinase
MGYLAKWIATPAVSPTRRYGLSLLLIGIAFGLSRAFLFFNLPLPFTSLALCAIAITFWYGGIRPGVLAALLSAVLRFFFFEPADPAISRLIYDIVFVVFAVLMTQATRARDELELRVGDRTADLTDANESLKAEIAERRRTEEKLVRADQEREMLRQAHADLARVSRVTTMGELTASLAHELNQPIAAAVTDATTCLSWLKRDHPNTEEACEAASRIVTDATRAAEIMSRIRLMFTKGAPERMSIDINDVIREMIALLHSEIERHSISIQTTLVQDIPQVMGDRVQLQQVMMNLIVNSIEAMKEVDGKRELTINSQRVDKQQLLVSVSDTGVGLPHGPNKIFDAFFTTKLHGTGMGLRISRSIIESHGGRLSAADNSPRGASFHIALPGHVQTSPQGATG